MSKPSVPHPPTPPPPAPPSCEAGLEEYNRVAETVGMVPSLRKQDNVTQAKWVGVGCATGALAGLIYGAATHSSLYICAMAGLLAGMLVSALISGIALMIVGLKRQTTRR